MSQHPDVVAMQQWYGGLGTRSRTIVGEGLLVLAGAWIMIAPWVVGFAVASLPIVINNLVIGLLVAALGLVLAGRGEGAHGVSWIAIPLGVWVIIATWIVPSLLVGAGMVWSNVIGGAVAVLVGAVVTTGTVISFGRHPHTATSG